MELDLPEETGLTVAVDTENSGLHPDDGARVAVVSLAWHDPLTLDLEVRAFPFDQGVRDKLDGQPGELALESADNGPNLGLDEWDTLLFWLFKQKLVFHNAKYDLMMLRAGTRHCPGKDLEQSFHWCTMVVQRLLDPTGLVGLEHVAKAAWGEDSQKLSLDEALKQHKTKRYDFLPWDEIRDYAAKDAELCLKLYHRQQRSFSAGEGQVEFLDIELQLCRVLYRMERRGMQFNAEYAERLADQVRERIRTLEGTLPFRATDHAAKKYFFEVKGILPYKDTKGGNPALDDEVLAKMVNDEIEWAAEYKKLSYLKTALSMWYQGYPEKVGPDGRLRTNFKQVSVKSGRMSVERVQLQAIPKDDKTIEGVDNIRDCFNAKDGHVLWNLDLGQAELRVAAKLSKCYTMLDLLNEGADLHGITCQEVLGTNPADPDWKTQRDIAKRLTFGGIFMIGGKRFKETLSKLAGIEISLAEADAYVRRWRSLYPEFGVTYRKAERLFRTRGWVQLVSGRISYKGPLDYPNTAWNRVVQGSLADFNKVWLAAVEEWAPPESLVMSVHDSVVLELPYGSRPTVEVIQAQSEKLARDHFRREALGDRDVGMPVDVEYWRKASKQAKDDDQYGHKGRRNSR